MVINYRAKNEKMATKAITRTSMSVVVFTTVYFVYLLLKPLGKFQRNVVYLKYKYILRTPNNNNLIICLVYLDCKQRNEQSHIDKSHFKQSY